MKSGQVIEDYKKNIFSLENKPGKLVQDLFLFVEKALYEVKASGLQLNCNIFR